jgi:hypothetical protein
MQTCLNLTQSYADKHTLKRKSEYITAQDPDEETKGDGLSHHQIKISLTKDESRMQRRQEQNGARAARRRAVLSDYDYQHV